MPEIAPFQALRYAEGVDLAEVTTPPYDVIPPAEQERLRASSPLNFVYVILPDGAAERYAKGAATFREWIERGVLVTDPAPAYYFYESVYATSQGQKSTAGLLCALRLENLGVGVLPHERTMPGPKADRLEVLRHSRANLEPLWFVASDHLPELAKAFEALSADAPSAEVADPDGVRHRMWRAQAERIEPVAQALAGTPVVIADGHHRYETALRYREEQRRNAGEGPWDFTLALIADPESSPPALLPIHRLARGISEEEIGSRVGLEPFDGSLDDLVSGLRPGRIGLAVGANRWEFQTEGPLDSAYLTEHVLERLGAEVEFQHDLAIVEERIEHADAGFLLAPVPLRMVVEVASKREVMPPKTTLFWPKPRSGLVVRDLAAE